MRRLIGITALLALLSACSDKKGSLSGDWKDSITYHTFMPQADCKETVFHLAYKATKDSLKVTNETGRIERSYYAVKGDTLTITDTAEMGGQKFTSNLILIKKK